MAQIALPFRIALVAVLVIGALWATVLRPKGADTTPAPEPTAPGVAGLTRAVDKANGAAATSDAANARIDAASGGQDAASTGGTAAPRTAAPAAPAVPAAAGDAKALAGVAAGDPSAPLVRALGDGKVAVLLFAGRRAADDRAARRAVRGVRTRHRAVVVKVVAPRAVGKYEAITRGAKVSQFPTLLVIGPDKVAKPITGFTTGGEVDQAVADAVVAARPLRRMVVAGDSAARQARRTCPAGAAGSACRTYFAQANRSCVAGAQTVIEAVADARGSGAAPQAIVSQFLAGATTSAGQFAALQPPAAQAAGHERAAALMQADLERTRRLMNSALKAPDPVGVIVAGARRHERSAAGKRASATMRRLGYAACA